MRAATSLSLAALAALASTAVLVPGAAHAATPAQGTATSGLLPALGHGRRRRRSRSGSPSSSPRPWPTARSRSRRSWSPRRRSAARPSGSRRSPRATPPRPSPRPAAQDVGGLLRLTPPALAVTSTGGAAPVASLGATSLGGVSLLGLPVALDGTLEVGSAVNDNAAGAGKLLDRSPPWSCRPWRSSWPPSGSTSPRCRSPPSPTSSTASSPRGWSWSTPPTAPRSAP